MISIESRKEYMNKKKLIIIGIAIVSVIAIIAGSTYAYWQITRTQETPNDIVAACLDLNLEDKSVAIDLDSAWPISDEEANDLTGYTFTVTNNCDEEVNYIVGLNRVEEDNYLQDTSVKVRLDDNSSHVYGELSNVEYSDPDNTYTSRISKQVSIETIGAKETNEHTIRVWVSESAPVTEQSKIFKGQVFITGGQGIISPSVGGNGSLGDNCFTIDSEGTIWGYDESCGLEVKVPAEINGIKVKKIVDTSFKYRDALVFTGGYGEDRGKSGYEFYDYIVFYNNAANEGKIDAFLKEEYCDEPENCDLTDYGFIKVYNLQEYEAIDKSKYLEYFGDFYTYNPAIDEIVNTGVINIKSLDLSETVYLETIGEEAFDGEMFVEEGYCEGKQIVEKNSCRTGINSIILPQNGMLKTIGDGAFEYGVLTEIFIPSSVEVIGDYAFHQYDVAGPLTKVTFEDTIDNPSKLTLIGEGAFQNNQLRKVIIPGSVTEIGEGAFNINPSLTEVIIKNTAGNVTIGEYAFSAAITPIYDPNYSE